VSATCPNCDILLVEANAATLASLGKAETTAAAADPVAIGNSFGVPETTSETNYDADFTHAGIASRAAGDNGYGVQYPLPPRRHRRGRHHPLDRGRNQSRIHRDGLVR